ncbi:MAG: hypothetical protein VB049_11670 [Candidatus Pelethousia sp.]|nr:hypothetical protein [Candidatus Pelethousia sp.]
MEIKQYDTVRLKDGRTGCAVEVFDQAEFIVDIGSSSADWDTITVKREDIVSVVHRSPVPMK